MEEKVKRIVVTEGWDGRKITTTKTCPADESNCDGCDYLFCRPAGAENLFKGERFSCLNGSSKNY